MKKLVIITSIKLFFIILILVGIIPLLFNIKFSFANGDTSFLVNSNLEMIELSTITGSKENESSFNINLPTDSWTLNETKFNFTEIQFENELEVIENQTYPSNFSSVYYQNNNLRTLGLAAQIKLNEPSILYGIYLYGYKEVRTNPKIIQVQVRGYSESDNKPNNTLYYSMNINMSSTEGWYFQNFTTSLSLDSGNYFLVLNGSNINSVNDDRYHWFYNNINPSNPDLYISDYSYNVSLGTILWNYPSQNSTLLYKMMKKINMPFYPESNNMTVQIEGNLYNVLNGLSSGEGVVFETNLDYSPHKSLLSVFISNNRTKSISFKLNYSINIYHTFFAPNSILIKNNSINQWSLTPTLTRVSNNYSIYFNYPVNWYNFTINKDQVNITQDVIINTFERFIFIPNDTISDGAEWEVKANSPKIPFYINAPKVEYYIGQELRFSILNPIAGNYTFLLMDPSGFEEYRFSILNPPVDFIFSYEIPSNAIEGIYHAFLFLFNGTDAGVQYQQFNITSTIPNNNNPLGLIIMLIFIIAAAIGGSSFVAIKKLTTSRREKLESILNKCNDILNLQYIIVIENKSGIDIFSRSFATKKLDTSLISGFLQAIRTFGTEVSEAAKDSRTVKLEYKDSIMLMTEFVNLRLITILKDQPSRNFLYLIEDLAYDIFKTYGNLIDSFSGNIKQFRDIDNLIEKHLTTSFLSPLKINLSKHIKLSQAEKQMVDQAMKFMRENNFNYFYSIYLLPENMCTPKDYKTILDLLHKGVFTPTTKT